jgi:ribosome-binding protein aMBF1 (putative translation factor)
VYCKICGTHRTVDYRRGSRMNLCDPCATETPKKATYEGFNRAYWGAGSKSVSESVKREYYSDYKVSTHTVKEYIEATSAWIFED